MATCISCGYDVTGKKFCQQCGTPVQPVEPTGIAGASATSANSICPRCNGEVQPGAAFCLHCGSSLSPHAITATAQSQPLTRTCAACHTEVPASNAFCSNCGQSMQVPAMAQASPTPVSAFCTNCGHQNAPGVRFCAACGTPIGATATPPMPQTGYSQPLPPSQPGQYPPSTGYPPQSAPYTQQPQYPAPYGQPQPQYPPQQYGQPYGQPQYPQQGYQQQPMMGQQPMVLRCPVCMAMAPLGTTNCASCHTSLAGIVPTPASMPVQGQQQGGLGGFMQGNGGKYAMGALGGAAAVIGGEMLLHGVEHGIEGDRDRGYGYERRDDDGMFGGLGDIANDIGLF